MKLEKNSYECWQAAYNKLQKSDDNVIEVSVDSADIESGSILNLRYFFPLALYFLRIKKRSDSRRVSMTLDIKMTGGEKTIKGDLIRLRRFFLKFRMSLVFLSG